MPLRHLLIVLALVGCERFESKPHPLQAPCRQLVGQLPTLAELADAAPTETSVDAQRIALEKSIALTKRSAKAMTEALASLPAAPSAETAKLTASCEKGKAAAAEGIELLGGFTTELDQLAKISTKDADEAIKRELKYMMAQCSRSVDKDCNRFRAAFKETKADEEDGTGENMMRLGKKLKGLRFKDKDMRRDVNAFADAILNAATTLQTAARVTKALEALQPKLDAASADFREAVNEIGEVCGPHLGE